MTFEIVTATEQHAIEMAPIMKEADVEEIWASNHVKPLGSLMFSIKNSDTTKALLVNGKTAAMFGVVPSGGGLSMNGVIWMLTSDEIFKHHRPLLLASKRYVDWVMQDYMLLANYVDARNHKTVKWLKWLGFTVEDAKPYGAEGLPFHYFYMTKETLDV